MIWETIGIIVGAITGFGGMVWGIVKYYDQKRAKQQLVAQTQEQARDAYLKKIADHMAEMSADNAERNRQIASLEEQVFNLSLQLVEVQTQLEDTQQIITDNEMDRLRFDILDFVNKINNGHKMTQVEFEHVHHCFDKYVERGGNSYIATAMEFIIAYEEECRREGLIDVSQKH